jgi:hypothetical protein
VISYLEHQETTVVEEGNRQLSVSGNNDGKSRKESSDEKEGADKFGSIPIAVPEVASENLRHLLRLRGPYF